MRRLLVCVLAAAVFGLAGCGGGSKSTSTAARTVAAATVGPTTTPTTSAKANGSARKKDQSPRTKSNSSPATNVAAVPTADTVTNGKPKSASASPAGCLNSAGLVQPGIHGRSLWAAYDPVSHTATVYVFGPLKSPVVASSDAQSRGMVGIAQPAGRYVVGATPPSNLDAQVHLVAKCLGGAGASIGSSKPITYSGGGSAGAQGAKGSSGRKGSGSRGRGKLTF